MDDDAGGESAGQSLFEELTAELQAESTISTGRMLHAEALCVRGKSFAFVGTDDRLIVKLPRAKAVEWVDQGRADFVVIGKRTLKEWVALPYGPGAGPDWTEAIAAARAYVGSLA